MENMQKFVNLKTYCMKVEIQFLNWKSFSIIENNNTFAPDLENKQAQFVHFDQKWPRGSTE